MLVNDNLESKFGENTKEIITDVWRLTTTCEDAKKKKKKKEEEEEDEDDDKDHEDFDILKRLYLWIGVSVKWVYW